MARVKDLRFSEVRDPADPEKKIKRKTARHPDNGGGKTAKRWLAVWIGPDGREKTKAFRSRERAKEYAARQEADIERGEYIDPKAGRELISTLTAKWRRLRKLSGGSEIRYESADRLHVQPTFGHRQVKSILPSEILEWLNELGKTHGPATQTTALHILQSTLDLAVADGMRRDNPAKSPIIPKIEVELKDRSAWTAAKLWSVIERHPEPYQAMAILAAGCSHRQGEAFGVAVTDFDFEAGTVRIDRQISRIGKEIVFKLPKGGKTRTVPLSPGVARAVQAHMLRFPPVETTLPWMNEDRSSGDPLTMKLLFVWRGQLLVPPLAEDSRTNAGRARQKTAEGQNLRTSVYNTLVWKPALALAGVIPPPVNDERGALRYVEAREEGMHNTRHYFSTALQDAGVNLAGVMDFMGHSRKGSRIPMSLGVYGHVTEETFEIARTAIDRALFPLRPVQDQRPTRTETERAAAQ